MWMQAAAAAVGYVVLPRVFGKSAPDLQAEIEDAMKKRFGQGPVIDVTKDVTIDEGYDGLDRDLEDFDKALRDRRRR
jgi:hypothetical protein